MRVLICGFLCTFCLLPRLLQAAAASPGEGEVLQCITEKSNFLTDKSGFRVIRMNLSNLTKKGDFLTYRIPFEEGHAYSILVCGESTIKKLELKVFNPEGYLEQQDVAMKGIQYQAKASGDYWIKILAIQGQGHISLSVMMK